LSIKATVPSTYKCLLIFTNEWVAIGGGDFDLESIMATAAGSARGADQPEGGRHPPVAERSIVEPGRSLRWPLEIRAGHKLHVFAVVAAALAILFSIHWFSTRNLVSADNAFLDGDVVQISPKIAGSVLSVNVTDNQLVRRGDILVTLDTREYQVAVESAKAMLDDAAAQLQAAKANRELTDQAAAEARPLQRDVGLAPGATAETETKLVAVIRQAGVQSAEAKVEAARATREQAELNLADTAIAAPVDGIVTRRRVNVGNQVDRHQELMVLVVGTPWVIANFKETQIGRIQPGQPVEITLDAFPGVTFKGHVDSIQRSTGARFALLSPENEMSHFVKVVQRVPVKIVFDELPSSSLNVSLGMSVAATIDVKGDEASRVRP
jgi:membrane fusion protein (multidrug efflux system)